MFLASVPPLLNQDPTGREIMPRARPKAVPQDSIEALEKISTYRISWAPKAREALTNDLDLNIRDATHKDRCDRMLESLAEELSLYHQWKHITATSMATRLAEISKTLPTLERALDLLGKLSLATLSDIDDVNFPDAYPLCRATLREFIVLMKRVQADLSKEETRGRPNSMIMIPMMIGRSATIFDAYYNGPTHDRREALKHFIQDAFRYSGIPIPSRLNPLLPK